MSPLTSHQVHFAVVMLHGGRRSYRLDWLEHRYEPSVDVAPSPWSQRATGVFAAVFQRRSVLDEVPQRAGGGSNRPAC